MEEIKQLNFSNIMKDKTAYLTHEEIQSMLDYCVRKKDIRAWMLIQTIYRTGRRISEIVGKKPFTTSVGLRPCDIHPSGLIEFDILKKQPVRTKTKSGTSRSEESLTRARLIKKPLRKLKPVDHEYLKWLKEYIEYQGIYPHDRIFPFTRVWAWIIISNVAKACNISRAKGKIHPHNFRHSFAIHLLKKHPNDASVLRQVQDLLDHSDIKITMEYAQFTQDDKRAALERAFNG